MKESKQLILNAAINEFFEMGYDGARVDNIAARSGLNKAMIYYHFKNKEELYICVLESMVDTLITSIRPNMVFSGSIKDKLEKIIDGYVGFFQSNPQFPKIFFREIASGGTYLKEIFREKMLPIIGFLQYTLKEGVTSGELKDTDYKFFILSVIGPFIIFFLGKPIFEVLLNHEYNENTIDEFKQFIFDTVYYGVKKR